MARKFITFTCKVNALAVYLKQWIAIILTTHMPHRHISMHRHIEQNIGLLLSLQIRAKSYITVEQRWWKRLLCTQYHSPIAWELVRQEVARPIALCVSKACTICSLVGGGLGRGGCPREGGCHNAEAAKAEARVNCPVARPRCQAVPASSPCGTAAAVSYKWTYTITHACTCAFIHWHWSTSTLTYTGAHYHNIIWIGTVYLH